MKIHQSLAQNTPVSISIHQIFSRPKIGGEPPKFSLFIAFLLTNIFGEPIFFSKNCQEIFFAKICDVQGQNKPENARFWAYFKTNQKYTTTPD